MWTAAPGFSASVTLRGQTGPHACSTSILPTEPSSQPLYPLKNYTVTAKFNHVSFVKPEARVHPYVEVLRSQEKSGSGYTKRWGSSSK